MIRLRIAVVVTSAIAPTAKIVSSTIATTAPLEQVGRAIAANPIGTRGVSPKVAGRSRP
jgi:hypothetical protein